MSDALVPWIVKEASLHLSREREQVELPRLAQLYIDSDGNWKISDGIHEVIIKFIPSAINQFTQQYPHRTLNSFSGSIIRVIDGRWIIYREKDAERECIEMQICHFEIVGGEGSLPHGCPHDIYLSESIVSLLRMRLSDGYCGGISMETDNLLYLADSTQSQSGRLVDQSEIDEVSSVDLVSNLDLSDIIFYQEEEEPVEVEVEHVGVKSVFKCYFDQLFAPLPIDYRSW